MKSGGIVAFVQHGDELGTIEVGGWPSHGRGRRFNPYSYPASMMNARTSSSENAPSSPFQGPFALNRTRSTVPTGRRQTCGDSAGAFLDRTPLPEPASHLGVDMEEETPGSLWCAVSYLSSMTIRRF
jgi:hypothetical protein